MSNNEIRPKTLGQKFIEWMDKITNESSIHGLVWYNRTGNKCLKILFSVLTLTAIINLPILIIIETIDWTQSKQVTISEIRKTERSLNYPPIVVCHPKFFNGTKMEGKMSMTN